MTARHGVLGHVLPILLQHPILDARVAPAWGSFRQAQELSLHACCTSLTPNVAAHTGSHRFWAMFIAFLNGESFFIRVKLAQI